MAQKAPGYKGAKARIASMVVMVCALVALMGCGARHGPAGREVSGGGSATRPVIAAGATASMRPAKVYTAAEIDKAIERGVEFLVKSQNKNGSWGTGTVTRGWEVYSMVPGSHDAFRVATTALCVMALREAIEDSGKRTLLPMASGEIAAAHDRGVEYLIAHGEAKRDDTDLMYNVWAPASALQALAGEMKG